MKMSKERIKYEIAENFADATTMITLTMPINTGIELFGANMTNQVSLNSRAYNLAVTYGGLTRLLKLRDYTKKKFNMDEKSSLARCAHDMAYGLTLGPLVKAGIYLAAGETDWKKIGIGVAGTMGIAGALAIPLGWMIDVGRDLWNVKESPRTPKYFKNKSKGFKKAVAAGVFALSISVTAGMYTANHFRERSMQENYQPAGIEQVVEAERD